MCDTGDRWISGLLPQEKSQIRQRSLHPNSPGQQAYAYAVLAALS